MFSDADPAQLARAEDALKDEMENGRSPPAVLDFYEGISDLYSG